jgi:serine/threonine-protein kinase
MPLGPGVRLGPYEIQSALGAGGMGEVYRATDINLGRDVAIKVLPDAFAGNPERVGRFEREAKTLASLNHPSIAIIHGLEKSKGTYALVMELVEGEDLSHRIARGPIPVDEALSIARQIAEALEAAHEQGIIHRDLKPANIKVRPDGTVKVLDFGLAKLAESSTPATHPGAMSMSPTITSPAMMTGVGVLLGTAAYMSPEQARGKAVDKRSDMWAFGCVLYEMLTGHRAFEGETVTETFAAVLRGAPSWDVLPEDTPTAIRVLMRRCLEKDRRERTVDATTVVFVIREQASLSDLSRPSVRSHQALKLVSGGLGLAALAGIAVWLASPRVAPQVTRLTIATSGTSALMPRNFAGDIAITPDGTRIVYRGPNQLLVRALGQLEPTPLSGVSNAQSLFVSPDSQWVGFFDGGTTLKKIAITGGPTATLAPSDGFVARGATWGEDNSIIYATSAFDTGLIRVSLGGGMPTALTKPDTGHGEVDHFWPESLPGGRAVLFTITAASGALRDAQVAVLDLRSGSVKTLLRGAHHAHYVSTGHLVYGSGGTLRTVPFDLERLEVTGASLPILDGVVTTVEGGVDVGISATGTLVYVPGVGGLGARRSLVWTDRSGHEEPVSASAHAYQYLRISPDGGRAVLDVRDQHQDIWTWEFGTQTLTPLLLDASQNLFPIWTRDNRHIVFTSQRSGVPNVYWQPADGTGAASRLTESANGQVPSSVSPDGHFLLITEVSPQTASDLLWMSLPVGNGKPGTPQPLIRTMAAESNGEISPNGRWLAYESDESGRNEIYLRPFPDVNGGRWQVSTIGGRTPLWSRMGDELFYRLPDGGVMGTRVEGGTAWRAAKPTLLTPAGYLLASPTWAPRTFDVSADGRRFLMIKEGGAKEGDAGPQIVVVQNWTEELKRLVPTN